MHSEQRFALPDWQRAWGPPPTTGRLRTIPEDFEVTEILGFDLSGDGEHDYLYIEKINANTNWVARGLARHAGVPIRDVGFAGMKDRHALTRQWFSVHRRPGGAIDWAGLDLPGVTVREVAQHRRKLRRGAHRGNRFMLRIRDVEPVPELLDERLLRIREGGVPNYFGEQRFGRQGSNLVTAKELFAGKRVHREQRSIAMSAARSYLFNQVLSARVEAGTWNRLSAGDVANLDGSASVFRVTDVDADIEARCGRLDIHPTGPLWGRGASMAEGAAGDLERCIADGEPELAAGLSDRADADRRALRLVPAEIEWQHDATSLCLGFFLGRGGYATVVVRELVAYDV